MDATNQNTDLFDQQTKELPGMLNVLTILTFIGCGLSYLSLLYGFYTSSNYEQEVAKLEEMQDKMGGDNEMAAEMMQGSLQMMEKAHEYRYILLLSGLLFTTLCLVGAMQMRKLKKSGYVLYTIGELAPLIITAALLGFSLMGGMTLAVSGIFALVFVILYTTQRKYLINP
ncbi:MAG TPA: hypothetical protein VM935_11530 [Chitinophagaceae bacterium]|jgi:hypothetical protein|nr:hypothetical protein [Chitinophagaceae bacterium]